MADYKIYNTGDVFNKSSILKAGEKDETKVILLGSNLLEGRAEMTYWKDKTAMQNHIKERKESVRAER